MSKSNSEITMHGNKINVTGTSLSPGDTLPDFTLTNNELKEVKSSELDEGILIISTIPSIDTPVCETETKHFNKAISEFSDKVTLLTVSRDLPFAQKRWCAAEGIENVVLLSDYKYRTFGKSFGVDIEDLGILTRAVFLFDSTKKLKYLEYVSEISNEPNYDSLMSELKSIIS